jgi:hypothetical protein
MIASTKLLTTAMTKNKFLFSSLLVLFFAGCSLFNSGDDGKKYNLEEFPTVPSDAPFSVSLDYENIQTFSGPALKLKLNIHNLKSKPLGFRTRAHGPLAGDNYIQFIIATPDTNLIWKRYRFDLRSAHAPMRIDSGATKTFTYQLNYSSNDKAKIIEGKYLLFAGMFDVTLYQDTTRLNDQNLVKRYHEIGVGRQPITITVGQ